MKKEIIVGLILVSLVGGFLYWQLKVILPSLKKENKTAVSPLPQIDKKSKLSLSEVTEHNKVSDCWIVIKGKVYDVTDYIDKHPGGKIISSFCGQDASEAFATKGSKNQPHSQDAQEVLPTLFIGELSQ